MSNQITKDFYKMREIKMEQKTKYIVLKTFEDYIDFTDGTYKYRLKQESFRKLKTSPHPLKSTNFYYLENIKAWLKLNNVNLTLVDCNELNKNRITWKCECGNVFTRSFSKIKDAKQYKCNECSLKSRAKKLRTIEEDIINILQNKGLKTDDVYINKSSKMTLVDKDGYKYHLTINNISNKDNLRKWFKTNPYSIDNIKRYIKNNNLDCEILSDKYIKCDKKLEFKCSCGEVFSCSIDHFTRGQNRCGKCSKNVSSLELKTEQWLKSNNIEFEKEKTFGTINGNRNPYRYDFYIPSKNMIIEVHGVQHYRFTKLWHKTMNRFKEMQERDVIKRDFAIKNGMLYLEIPYTKFSNKDEFKEILHSNLIGK